MKPEDVKPGVRVRHWKGGEYEIVLTAIMEGSGEELVVYRQPGSAVYFVRPLLDDIESTPPFCGFTSGSNTRERFAVIPGV